MKIKDLYIENFGKLSKFKLSFSDGMNSFIAENGYGKTTLSVFIKAMMYGFEDTRRQSLDENERKKYTPWQGGAFGGYLTFERNGVLYRVERSFGQKSSDDTFTLYNLNTGTPSNDFSSSLGEELFGIDSDGFERTVFLSEKNVCGKNTNQTISAKLSDLVGTEGDIGGFDDAIRLLDDRRRFYQKRGGAGEIQGIETEISELEERIKDLYAKREYTAKIEAHLSSLNEKLSSLRYEKGAIAQKEREERLEREKQGYEIRYSEMLGALKNDEARERELMEFFEKKLPTNTEMALAAENVSEIYRLKRKLSELGENSELSDLKEFFTAPTTYDECEKMKDAAKRLSERRAESLSHQPVSTVKSQFKRNPTSEEIATHSKAISKAKQDASPKGKAFSFIGLIITIAGICGGYMITNALYLLSACGLLLTFVGISSIIVQKNAYSKSEELKNALDFIFDVYGENRIFHSAEEALVIMEGDLAAYLEKASGNDTDQHNSEKFLNSLEYLERTLREFCEKFPAADGLTFEEKTEIIAYKRRRYEILLEFESERERERQLCNDEMRSHCERLYKFISLFPVKSDDPIAEIRRNLAEYEVIRTSLNRRRSDAESFACLHGIDLSKKLLPQKNVSDDVDFTKTLSEIEEELLTLVREKTRAEAEYNMISREIESIDELEEKLGEKQEKIRIFRENLTVITKTKDILSKAKDSMTARYLDSTKRGFEKYVELFDEANAEFTVDTSFSFMKSDMGRSRQAEAYSRGTRDMHALAMRLALLDSLYSQEIPPIILDDPFTAFDDEHVEKAIKVLKKLSQDRQILYFTCSASRRIKQ